jgi:glycosyltransferase involved in cell wall biosynthesis
MKIDQPLVSVIIPCYNHGSFLAESIRSVYSQTYSSVQIIVVDDGSTDDTAKVAKSIPNVNYIYQENAGLSAARNTGIKHSQGDFLVFLDADDLLYPDALSINVTYLQAHQEAVFVSGAHDVVSVTKRKLGEKRAIVTSKHYIEFLRGNYIGMHATVMFRRSVFNEFLYDETLTSCEDYDIYLKVARKYPVIHHTEKLTAYRMHSSNMSGNASRMLSQVLHVLNRQKEVLLNKAERQAYRKGVRFYTKYYTIQLFYHIQGSDKNPSKESLDVLWKKNKILYMRYLMRKYTPDFALRFLNRVGIYKKYRPPVGKVRWGNMRSLLPFSADFGFDRGLPIDRYYIENFLSLEAENIKGRVLEIGDNEYTMRFGKEKVQKSEILHVDSSNPNATIVGDLSDAPQIEDNSFDAIILTQTLHIVYDYKKVIKTCYRILKPGGVLLMTVPGITPVNMDEWDFLYSFTKKSVEMILAEEFPQGTVHTDSYGNVHTATAFLYGLATVELKKNHIDFLDTRFPVIISARAVKPV